MLHLQSATGEVTEELVELGALVTGVDLSSEAIDEAREHAPDIAFIHADVTRAPGRGAARPRFDLVLHRRGARLVRDLGPVAGRNRGGAQAGRDVSSSTTTIR